VTSAHSGDWLHALPLSGCGLRLDDRAVHIAVGLRLGANICELHQCPCGAKVDSKGLHGLSCKVGSGRSARHLSFNDLVWRAVSKVDIPAVKEPSGLLRTDGKRPDGVTLIPWKHGMCHMACHGDGYDGTILPSCDISDVGCCSRSDGGQEDSQVCPIDAGIFVHDDCS